MTEQTLPHARDRAPHWVEAWRAAGALVLLLDFDGTLSPIVDQPERAAMAPRSRKAIAKLLRMGASVAIVSGRGLADARGRVGIGGIAYAGNHGMEIEMPGLRQTHPAAEAARPDLERVADRLQSELAEVRGAIVEDKGLTLSVHYRQVDRKSVERVRGIVLSAVKNFAGLKVTEGKEVLEVRPAVEWDKGRAVEFLLDRLKPPAGTPVLYLGDDRTDEDAFAVLRGIAGAEGILVAGDLPAETEATCFVQTTEEVAELLDLLVDRFQS